MNFYFKKNIEKVEKTKQMNKIRVINNHLYKKNWHKALMKQTKSKKK